MVPACCLVTGSGGVAAGASTCWLKNRRAQTAALSFPGHPFQVVVFCLKGNQREDRNPFWVPKKMIRMFICAKGRLVDVSKWCSLNSQRLRPHRHQHPKQHPEQYPTCTSTPNCPSTRPSIFQKCACTVTCMPPAPRRQSRKNVPALSPAPQTRPQCLLQNRCGTFARLGADR